MVKRAEQKIVIVIVYIIRGRPSLGSFSDSRKNVAVNSVGNQRGFFSGENNYCVQKQNKNRDLGQENCIH